MGIFGERMAGFRPLRIARRPSQYPQHSQLPAHDPPKRRNSTEEKYAGGGRFFSDQSDWSDYDSSSGSSRSTSGSFTSDSPLKRKRRFQIRSRTQRSRLCSRILLYFRYALISTIIIFVGTLIRMSVVSSRRVELGELGDRPPPPPQIWESFEFLARYYGGLKSMVPLEDNIPEYPREGNETRDYEVPTSAATLLPSRPFNAYHDPVDAFNTERMGASECFLDENSKIRVPRLQNYNGRPNGFPDNVMGSYATLDLPEDICFDRYGRLGPYGYGYSLKAGGTGTGLSGDRRGVDSVWEDGSNFTQIDYRSLNWADAQRRCYQANSARFEQQQVGTYAPTTFNVGKVQARGQSWNMTTPVSNLAVNKPPVARTAVVIRAWDEFIWGEEDILNLRAMIMELSLGSGGEYDVHLLVQVKDDSRYPIWADARTYHEHLERCVPEEFRDVATLWSQTQMLMLYQGIYDTYGSGPENPIHGSYRGLQMAMQHFSQRHPEYQFYWHWELDARYTGHYYDLFSKLDSWTEKQPRKGLWERSSRFYVPAIHGSWEDFTHMVRVQTEMGTDNPNNMWSSLRGAKEGTERSTAERPIWGPERPREPSDWFEIENDIEPPHTYEKDKYEWGVGEPADLITLNPLFDPDGTTWLLADDITGYNTAEGLPPRRAAIVSAARMSRRLLNTMHRETAFKKHFAFSEMWAPTVALHHGYKAVYAPHPVFIDRDWPVDYLASVMNAGRNGATGGARTSVFGLREHQLKGTTWYYNAGFAPNLWKRWLGLKVDNEGGEEFELTRDEGRNGKGVLGMRGGEGRMCLPPMLLHPVKQVLLPVEEARDELEEQQSSWEESDPSA